MTIPIRDQGIDPESNGYPDEPPEEEDGISAIFGAADYTTLVKPKNTAISRKYRNDTYSILKSLMIGAIKTDNMADAATIVYHGPSFGIAVGQLADADEKARRVIDFLTSPSNPYITFALTSMTLVSQLVRNHEQAISEIPAKIKLNRRQRKAMKSVASEQKPQFTAHLFGRDIPIRYVPRIKFKAIFSALKTQTHKPDDMVETIFGDPKLLKALEDQGIILVRKSDNEPM